MRFKIVEGSEAVRPIQQLDIIARNDPFLTWPLARRHTCSILVLLDKIMESR